MRAWVIMGNDYPDAVFLARPKPTPMSRRPSANKKPCATTTAGGASTGGTTSSRSAEASNDRR
jgi:hypothetical protein